MSDAADWIWYGTDAEGDAVISFGRWAKHPCQNRYKLAEIQPTEHDHPTLARSDGGWRPIETAPKDGSEIMIGSRNYSGEAFCALVKWDEKAGEWMLFDPSDDAWSWPTYGPLYWMPLPTVPGSENWTRNKDAIGLRQALDRS